MNRMIHAADHREVLANWQYSLCIFYIIQTLQSDGDNKMDRNGRKISCQKRERKEMFFFYSQNLYISLIYYRSHRCFCLHNGVRHASKCDENFDGNINEDDTHTKRRNSDENTYNKITLINYVSNA